MLAVATVLSQLEQLKDWSDALAFVVSEWREIMYWFWDFWLQFILAFLPSLEIEISEPYPELLTFITLVLSSIRISKVLDHHLVMMSENKNFFIFLVFKTIGNPLLPIFLTFVTTYIVLGSSGSIVIAFIIVVCHFIIFAVIQNCFSRFGNTKSADVAGEFGASFWYFCTLVFFLSGVLMVSSFFLELFVEKMLEIEVKFQDYRALK